MAAIDEGKNYAHITATTNTLSHGNGVKVCGVLVCGEPADGNDILLKDTDTSGTPFFKYHADPSNLAGAYFPIEARIDQLYVSALDGSCEVILYFE